MPSGWETRAAQSPIVSGRIILTSKDLIKRLGSFLADVTMDRPPARIHAELLSRVEQTWPNTDPQLAQVYGEEKDFISVWTAIRNGAALPEASWDRVVLPTVVFYSTGDLIKKNLETALHLWQAARNAPDEPLPAEETAQMRLMVPAAVAADIIDADVVEEPPAKRKRGSWRWWVPAVAAACVGLLLFAFTRADQNALGSHVPSNTPPAPESAFVQPLPEPSMSELLPSLEPPPPSQSPSPSIVPPKPSPATSWSAAPVVDPTAPQNLRVLSTTRKSVTLAWEAPANWGSGGADHYRVFKNGMDLGPTPAHYIGKTVAYLTPGTSYTFVVRAYNKAGRESGPSNSIVGKTDSWPAPVISTSPDSSNIELGKDITVSGSNIPCDAAATVDVLLDGHLVAQAAVDGSAFQTTIDVFMDSGLYYYRWQPMADWIELKAGSSLLTVRLPADQAGCMSMADQQLNLTITEPEDDDGED
jgi:chitodextrinase